MSFKPIQTDCRRSLGSRFAYAVRGKNQTASGRLRISICAELMTKAGFKDGDFVRLDVDAEAGMGRLMQVIVRGEAVRRVMVRSAITRRGHYELPWTGTVPQFFPAALTTELEVVEVKAGELTFELPVSAAPAQGVPARKGGRS